MAASMRNLALLGLVVASFCVAAEATYRKPATTVDVDVDVDVKVALQLNLKQCSSAVRVYVGANANAVACAGGALTILNPVEVHLDVPHLLYVNLEILGSAVVKARVVLDLRTVGKLVGNVHYIVLDVVQDTKYKKVNVFCLGVVVASVNLDINLDVGIHL